MVIYINKIIELKFFFIYVGMCFLIRCIILYMWYIVKNMWFNIIYFFIVIDFMILGEIIVWIIIVILYVILLKKGLCN